MAEVSWGTKYWTCRHGDEGSWIKAHLHTVVETQLRAMPKRDGGATWSCSTRLSFFRCLEKERPCISEVEWAERGRF